MKIFALTLVVASFLAGSFLSVLDPRLINWNYMVPVLIAGLVGLWIYRRVQNSETRSGHRLAGNIETLGKSLDSIVANLENLNTVRDELPVYEARFQIDSLFRDDLIEFADARESMIHVFGMQTYANVMSNFAAGERYINRVWSASTDGYVDEVRLYIERARDQFLEGQKLFRELLAAHSDELSGHQNG